MWLQRLTVALKRTLSLLVLALFLVGSTLPTQETADRVRRYTRPLEFDFAGWTLEAAAVKLGQFSLGATGYLAPPGRRELVLEYVDLIRQGKQIENRLAEIYGDPNLTDPEAQAAPVIDERARLRAQQAELQPTAEALLQEQVAVVLAQMGLGVAGAPVPPVAFHFSRVPVALVVSPREVIRQDANIQLDPDISLEEKVALEQQVEGGLGVSALVVPIGGVGSYPTMIQESADLAWVAEVVAHEWVHNYLTLRPLGMLYESSPELRTMNETVASLLGKRIGRAVLARYYPERLPPEPSAPVPPPSPAEPPAFDFHAEMRETRLTVDRLLAEGKVEEAEAYMETRRRFFWQNGYHIRRLNQAYFAFYGAYADQPGGAAGEDPVGAAVRELWERIDDPARFLRTMAWITSYEELQERLTGMGQLHAQGD